MLNQNVDVKESVWQVFLLISKFLIVTLNKIHIYIYIRCIREKKFTFEFYKYLATLIEHSKMQDR